MSSDRTCNKCGRTFKYPKYLRAHQQRKTPCPRILEKEDLPEDALEDPNLDQRRCRFCGRVFGTYTSMRRHVRGACAIAPNTRNGGEGMQVLYDHVMRKQESRINALENQQSKMIQLVEQQSALLKDMAQKDVMQSVKVSGGNTSLQTGDIAFHGDQVIGNKTINVQLNFFGQESLNYVTSERIKNILDLSLKSPAIPSAASTAVVKTAMLVYSDADHPENLTCYLPNKKTNDVLVHGIGGWEIKPATLVLPPMAQKSIDALFDHQPFENAQEYGPLLKELIENEKRYASGGELRPLLVRNKDLLMRALKHLPLVEKTK